MATKPRILLAVNPIAGLLQIDFSDSMLADDALTNKAAYTLNPSKDSSLDVSVVSALVTPSIPSRVTIRFAGGTRNAWYTLSAQGVSDLAGNPIDPVYSTTLIQIVHPSEDEYFGGEKLLFETNMGAVILDQATLSSMRIEDLVITRIRNLGHHEQFAIIAESLKNAGISGDDTRLKLFKG